MALSSVIYIAVLVYGIASTRGEDAVTLAVSFVVLVALIMIALALIEKFRGKHTFTCSLYRAYSSPAISVFQALKM